jgi:hypothetical protein
VYLPKHTHFYLKYLSVCSKWKQSNYVLLSLLHLSTDVGVLHSFLNGTRVDTPLGNIKFCLLGTTNVKVPLYVKLAPGLISFFALIAGLSEPNELTCQIIYKLIFCLVASCPEMSASVSCLYDVPVLRCILDHIVNTSLLCELIIFLYNTTNDSPRIFQHICKSNLSSCTSISQKNPL